MTRFLIVLIFFGMSGCATSFLNETVPNSGVQSFVSYLTFNERPYKGTKENKDNLFLAFPLISGSFFGNPNEKDYFRPSFDNNGVISIDLLGNYGEVQNIAKQFSQAGLTADPATVKVARVATFAVDRITMTDLGLTGWKDNETKEFLILVYFSEKTHIKGVIKSKLGNNLVDVKIKGEGFYWLKRRQNGKSTWIVETSQPPKKILLDVELPTEIDPPDNFDRLS